MKTETAEAPARTRFRWYQIPLSTLLLLLVAVNVYYWAYVRHNRPGDVHIKLEADQSTVSPGEKITFTTTLTNPGSKPVNVYVGYSTSGIMFVSGAAFRVALADGKGEDALIQPEWQVGFCGLGAGPLFATLRPGRPVVYRTTTTFGIPGKGAGKPVPDNALAHSYNFGPEDDEGDGYVNLTIAAPTQGEHRVRVRLKILMDPSDGGGESGVTDENAPYWTGSIVSNDVVVNVVDPNARPAAGCAKCGGAAYTTTPCLECGGMGHWDETRKSPCYDCEGTGKINVVCHH